MKHTKEPWSVPVEKPSSIVANSSELISGVWREDAQRIVDCVNALEGIENPAKFVEVARSFANTGAEAIVEVGQLRARVAELEYSINKISSYQYQIDCSEGASKKELKAAIEKAKSLLQ